MNRLDWMEGDSGCLTRNETRAFCIDPEPPPLGPQPERFHIVAPYNFSKYTDWLEKAQRDAECSRFLRQQGWHQPLAAGPTDDFYRTLMVSEKSLIDLSFDRSPVNEIGIGVFTIGDLKPLATASALRCLYWLIRRYSYFRWVRSGCLASNVASLKLHRRIYGEPWGIEPEGFYDESLGKAVDSVRFKIKTVDLLERFRRMSREK